MSSLFGNAARVVLLLGMTVAAVGSATSSTSNTPNNGDPNQVGQSAPQAQGQPLQGPPAAQPMDPQRSLGLWKSTFGAVKIESDEAHGGLQSGNLQGVWVYQRRGEEVVGYFNGNLHGNVFEFKWQEPNNPPLTGSGYLVFDASGRQYSGRWWSDARDRQGDWNGWRQAAAPQNRDPQPQPDPRYRGQDPYGGRTYGPAQPYQPYQPPQPPPTNYGPAQPGPAQPGPTPVGPSRPY